jgi:lysophospholipase L1-like esterase
VPLGDSITETTCWRTLLWDNLATAGVADKIEFVGSMTDNIQDCIGKTATWDHHHEGHSGYLAMDIANYDLVGWLISAKPDVVMFMLGTNDVLRGHTTSEITAAYTEMVQEMRASNPRMKIIVSFQGPKETFAYLTSSQIDLVIPLPFLDAEIANLNAEIPIWARSHNSTASPIYVADCNTGFPSTALRDGVHPNTAGDQIIASRLSPILLQAINQSKPSLTATTKVALIAHGSC